MFVPNRYGMFTDEEIDEAKENNKMLSIGLNLGHKCNLRCIYCLNSSGKFDKEELNYDEIKNLIKQCVECGIKEIVIPGTGEPTCSKYLIDIIKLCGENNIRIELFTNGILLTDEIIFLLKKYNCCITLKYHSRNQEVQDILVGKKGYSVRLNNILNKIIEAGFTQKHQLSLSNQITKLNYDNIIPYYIFCRENNIIPKLARLLKMGRAIDNWNRLFVSDEDNKKIFNECKRIDRGYGLEWYNYNPNFSGGYGCRLLFYSPEINFKGTMYPCIGKTEIIGNLRENSLIELWNNDVMNKYKNIDKNLTGECTKCKSFIEKKCYSCVRENLIHNRDPFISYRKCEMNFCEGM